MVYMSVTAHGLKVVASFQRGNVSSNEVTNYIA